MKHNDTIKNTFGALAITFFALVTTGTANAQCTTWVNPTDSSGWSDFTTTFGGAPCDNGQGCPVNEISAFELWADEAYAMNGVAAGGTYTFSACNGVGGTAWAISFTVIAPSGAVDAFGLDAGSSCALTFTATESGNYIIVSSEVGACGTSTNTATDNGFPAMTCASSAATACANIGVTEVNSASALTISPNPTTDRLVINIGGSTATFDMNLVNAAGQNVMADRINNSTVLDLSTFENGVYVLEIRNVLTGAVSRERVVKQ